MAAAENSACRRTCMAITITLILSACAAPMPKPSQEPGPDRWQALAKADLDDVHRLILEAHPGALDELNPAFMAWTEAGYQELSFDQIWDWFATSPGPPNPERTNRFEVQDGVLWIHAANFLLRPDQVPALKTMLDELPMQVGVRAIVFDARRNGGGDSSVGGRTLMQPPAD